VWTGGKSRPHRDSILDRPALSRSLYRVSYPAHILPSKHVQILKIFFLKVSFQLQLLIFLAIHSSTVDFCTYFAIA